MTIYEILNNIFKNEKFELSPRKFCPEYRDVLADEDKPIFDLLKNISSLAESVDNDRIEFCPMFVAADGSRIFSIEDISDSEFSILNDLDFDKLPLTLRARVSDLLWVSKKDFNCAKIAARSNWELFKLWYKDDDNLGSLDRMRRAICISRETNLTAIYNEICAWVKSFIESESVYAAGFFSLRLMELFVEQKNYDSAVFIPILDEIIKRNVYDVSITEQAYNLKTRCLFKNKRKEEAIRNNILLADYYVNHAEGIVSSDTQGALRAVPFYQKAIQLYRNNGEAQRGEETLKKLVEIQKNIPSTMAPFLLNFNVGGIVENIETNMKDLSFEESVIRITQMIKFDTREEIKQRVIDEYKSSPIFHLFSKSILNEHGQTILTLPPLDLDDPEKDQRVLELHMHQKALEHQNIVGDIWIKNALRIIQERFTVDNLKVDFLVKDNPIIPTGREGIIRSGVKMFLCGEYYEAMHILAPQTENIFRNIAREARSVTVTLEEDGSSKEKVLQSIFSLPELVDCYDNDTLFAFRGLLNELAGANIRNKIAHGIISEYDCSSGACLFFGAAIIRLLSYTSKECINILRNSEKLKHYEILKEDALKKTN